MSDSFFLDTNVLLYSIDKNNSKKQQQATHIIAKRPVISTQVINEFVSVCIRKRLKSYSEAEEIVAGFYDGMEIRVIDEETIRNELRIAGRYKFRYYDALILSPALEHGCRILYSEDLQHKQKIDALTIINPFV